MSNARALGAISVAAHLKWLMTLALLWSLMLILPGLSQARSVEATLEAASGESSSEAVATGGALANRRVRAAHLAHPGAPLRDDRGDLQRDRRGRSGREQQGAAQDQLEWEHGRHPRREFARLEVVVGARQELARLFPGERVGEHQAGHLRGIEVRRHEDALDRDRPSHHRELEDL